MRVLTDATQRASANTQEMESPLPRRTWCEASKNYGTVWGQSCLKSQISARVKGVPTPADLSPEADLG